MSEATMHPGRPRPPRPPDSTLTRLAFLQATDTGALVGALVPELGAAELASVVATCELRHAALLVFPAVARRRPCGARRPRPRCGRRAEAERRREGAPQQALPAPAGRARRRDHARPRPPTAARPRLRDRDVRPPGAARLAARNRRCGRARARRRGARRASPSGGRTGWRSRRCARSSPTTAGCAPTAAATTAAKATPSCTSAIRGRGPLLPPPRAARAGRLSGDRRGAPAPLDAAQTQLLTLMTGAWTTQAIAVAAELASRTC